MPTLPTENVWRSPCPLTPRSRPNPGAPNRDQALRQIRSRNARGRPQQGGTDHAIASDADKQWQRRTGEPDGILAPLQMECSESDGAQPRLGARPVRLAIGPHPSGTLDGNDFRLPASQARYT